MLRLISKLLFLLFLFRPIVCGAVSLDTVALPYPAHAHNDYMHERPLFDALENGFRSIEADVFTQGDSLYVAHDRKDITPGRTLRALYLKPLMEYISEDRKIIYDSASPLILLIDIKDHGLTTYKLLDRILNDFREILCKVSHEDYVPGSVMVVVSGNRPIEYMNEQTQRFAFVDGRMKDLTEEYTPLLMPLISDRWTKYFSWMGKGDMPEKERTQLRLYVQQAHEKGQLIRFWATPDSSGKERQAVWTELLDAGVDLVNTDDLAGLRAFLWAQTFHSYKQ
jgi:hypothetical protein